MGSKMTSGYHLFLLSILSIALTGCGGGGGSSDSGSNSAPGGGARSSLALFAGGMGGPGNADGVGVAARVNTPVGVATDSAGNVYVGDTGNNTIRKITPSGVVTTLAGTAGASGSTDASGAAASFSFPQGVATDSAGNVYVADNGNGTIRKITPAGAVTTLAGTAEGIHGGGGGSADGTGAAARFLSPRGVATDSADNVYVADSGNNTIRKITPAGVVTTLAGTSGNSGSTDATGAAARFNFPIGVATDSAGNIYVGDSRNNTIRKITPAGVVTTLSGSAGVTGSGDATGAAASFNLPQGVATDSAGNVYVADTLNSTIRKTTPTGVLTTLAGVAGVSGSTDATGAAASFNNPTGLGTDSAGNVYVADSRNNTIRKITFAGVVTTLAGTAGVSGSTDATGAAARFNNPTGLGTDGAGNVYVADTFNGIIRKITPAGLVTTLAGTAGVRGFSDGTGPAASFTTPYGGATDSAGNVYIVDSAHCSIRKITTPAGVVTTVGGVDRGHHGCSGAGGEVNGPFGVATDSADNVYASHSNGQVISKLGLGTVFAGMVDVIGSTDATGAAARFNRPLGVATDSAGNVYVADTGNHTIRMITPTGAVSTIVGVVGQAGFAPGPLPGLLSSPRGVAVSGTSLYITLDNGVAVVQNRP